MAALRTMGGSRWIRRSGRMLGGILLAASLVGSVPRTSIAQDDASAFRDLAIGSDFRVRVAAALALGKSKSPGARPALEKALANDPHPAVRVAAAAALGVLGDPRAVPALKTALATESNGDVKGAIDRAVTRLATAATPSAAPQHKARFLVALGKLENKSGVVAAKLAPALKSSTRSRLALVPGVEVLADGADAGAEARSRNLPAFTVDGTLTRLDKQQGADNLGFAARVEYVIRKMPDQKLTGTMRGSAAAFADAKEVRGPDEVAQLQLDALAAAVDNALKGASPTLEAAVR